MQRLLSLFLGLLVANDALAQVAPAPRFRSGAEVIAIDVTVVDRNGAPVADLTAADFDVTVEGRRRDIQSAQFLRSDAVPRLARADESSNTDPTSGRLLVIVTDDVSLQQRSYPVVSAARALLEQLGPGDLVGVAHIPEGGGVPMKTDHARVIAELQRLRPARPRFASSATVYISEALDYDDARRFQWPAAVARECGAQADGPVFRLCMLNLEQTARTVLLEASMHATETIRGLERLMKSLASSGQPATIVLISESLVLARDPGALVGLADACAEARVTLHVVQPAPQTAVMTDRGFPSDPVGDTALQVEGLEQMAARARGEFYRAAGDGASIFRRIGQEITGYYLLGIEPADEDRRQPRRRVDVKVRRPGLTVRARSMFALDRRAADSPAAPAARLKQLLESATPERALPIRITTRTLSGEGQQVRVLLAAEVGEPTDQRVRFHVGLVAADAFGDVKSRTAASTVLAPARAGRQSPSLFTTNLLLDPGDYSIRLAVVDESGRAGSVHHTFRAALREWPHGWRTSDLIAANQPSASEFPPFNASSIVDTERVAAVLEVANDDGRALNELTVRFEISGEVIVAEGAPASTGSGRPVRSFASLIAPPAGGEQVLRATISAPGAEPITIERSFSHDPPQADPLDPAVMRGFIEMLDRAHPTSPALAAFVAAARSGQFIQPPDADSRPDGDLAMVTFIGGLSALRDGKPALARALLQQTLRKAPGFEGARVYLALIR